jgi:hypothetical protein
MAARVLVRLAQFTHDSRYAERARRIFDAFLPFMHRAPRGAESLIYAAALYFDTIATAPNGDVAMHPPESTEETPDVAVRAYPLTLGLYTSKDHLSPGETLQVALQIEIDEGWHINSHNPIQDYLIPTRLTLQEKSFATLKEVSYPSPTQVRFEFSPEPMSVHVGPIWILATIQIEKVAEPGDKLLAVELAAQACDTQKCLAPETHLLTFPLQIVDPNQASTLRHKGLFDQLQISH